MKLQSRRAWRGAVILAVLLCLGDHVPSSVLAATEENRGFEATVLVTGAAGFIGYHLVSRLVHSLDTPPANVVGIDNFSPTYDVSLKIARAAQLKQMGVTVHHASACEEDYLRLLFGRHGFTHVVHLAAEPGVRRSLEHPSDYLPNISCFATLLDVVKDYQGVYVLLASSSSVYGFPEPRPFSPHQAHRQPSNMYALSKTASEMFAEQYCEEYFLQTLALRFFTVYGPWGRPDMAVYKFTQQLAEGNTLTVSMATADGSPVMRDFTYIDDVIDGIVMAMKYRPKQCGEAFNLGYGSPVAMETMLHLLQEEFGAKGHVVEVPLGAGELPVTHSDNSASRDRLGYRPRVALQEGLRKFVAWFRNYRASSLSAATEEALLLVEKQLIEHSDHIRQEIVATRVDKDNKAYKKRLKGLQQKFANYAESEKIELPNIEKKGFVFFPGVQCSGRVIAQSPGLALKPKALARWCSQVAVCVAFSSDGRLYSDVGHRGAWLPDHREGQGLYVADIDMCLADLHHCPPHSSCQHQGPAEYSCECDPGFATPHCIPIYTAELASHLEEEAAFEDQINGLDRKALKEDRPFVFFPGLDSGGGDYAAVLDPPPADRLKDICRSLRGCLGFTSNGILKHSLQPFSAWHSGTTDSSSGLYVIDVDYCSLGGRGCPRLSSCLRAGPGQYSCSCQPPLVMDPQSGACVEGEEQGEDRVAHVIMSVDGGYWEGLVAAMSSVLAATPRPAHVRFHLVLSGGARETLLSFLACFTFLRPGQVEVVEMQPEWLEGRITVHIDSSVVGNLASVGNFARFYFHQLFPDLEKGIYLDSDIIVKGDIFDFWSVLSASDSIIVAAKRTTPTYQSVFSERAAAIFKERYGYVYRHDDPTFNAGVYGVNLRLWRERGVTREVEFWMEQNRNLPLWQYGTQPLMLIALHGQWSLLDPRWNLDGLGWKEQIDRDKLEQAFLLHWSGKLKPWLDEGLYRSYWLPHRPVECSNHGNCVMSQGWFSCKCYPGNQGQACQVVAAQ